MTLTSSKRPRNPKRPRIFAGRAAGKPRSRSFILFVGFAVVAVSGLMFWIGYNAPNSIPGRSYYTIYAYMHDADNLEDHYDVRIGGLDAGQVISLEATNHGVAKVGLQLSAAFKPIRTGSHIEIRLRSAVGVRYVDLIPSTSGKALPNDGTLPVSQTSTPVDLDQVLDIFNAPTRTGTQNFIGQLGEGLAGEGQTVNQLLAQAPGTVRELGSVSKAVNANFDALKNLISGAQGTAQAVQPVTDYMVDGYSTDIKAAQPFITQRPTLDASLDQLPPTLAAASSELPAVRTLVSQVHRMADAMTPTLAHAPRALRNTTSLLVEARPGLKNAKRTLQLANTAVNPTLTFLETADPVLPQINDAITDLDPTVDYLAPRSCGLSTAMTGWSEMMKWGTPYDNFIRFTLTDVAPITGSSAIHDDTSPYPGPCTSAGDESGPLLQTPEQQVANP